MIGARDGGLQRRLLLAVFGQQPRGHVFGDLVLPLGEAGKACGNKNMRKEIEDLKLKKTSSIIKTNFGYHIIRVMDKKPAHTAPLEEVKKRIVQNLLEQAKSDVLNQWKRTMFENIKVERNYGLFETLL